MVTGSTRMAYWIILKSEEEVPATRGSRSLVHYVIKTRDMGCVIAHQERLTEGLDTLPLQD